MYRFTISKEALDITLDALYEYERKMEVIPQRWYDPYVKRCTEQNLRILRELIHAYRHAKEV